MFASCKLNIFILPNGMGRNRVLFFKDALLNNGASYMDDKVLEKFQFNDGNNLYILVDETSLNDWISIEKIISKKKFYTLNVIDKIKIIKSSWLSECLKRKSFVDLSNYEIKNPENDKTFTKIKRNSDEFINDTDFELIVKKKKQKNLNSSNSDNESDTDSYKSALSSFEESDNDNEIHTNSYKEVSNSYICTHSSKEQKINHNKDITDKLEELCLLYQNTKDKYRALGYQKAIAALKQHPKRITTLQEAKSLRGVGKRLADKILEIIETGELQKLDEYNSRDDMSSIKIFTNIHGIGPTTAQAFVAQGFRTIDDLKANASLNKQQKIGIKYYEEFLKRIPREEVQEIERIVKIAALSINPGLIVQTCGSFRRNKATCGDVDILVTHPDGHSHKGIFNKLIDLLHEQSRLDNWINCILKRFFFQRFFN
jgi:DNA polymerase lambda